MLYTTTFLLVTCEIFNDLKKNWLFITPPHLKYVSALPSNLLIIACFLTLLFLKVVRQHVQGVVVLVITILLQIS